MHENERKQPFLPVPYPVALGAEIEFDDDFIAATGIDGFLSEVLPNGRGLAAGCTTCAGLPASTAAEFWAGAADCGGWATRRAT